MEIPLLIGIVSFIFFYVRYFGPLRFSYQGFPYVYVDMNGMVRELDDSEKDYLDEKFHPADGARPYIKNRYSELTPDNKIHGFIKRNRVPFYIQIKK